MDFLSTNNLSCNDDTLAVNSNTIKKLPTINYEQNNEQYITTFSTWNENEQLCFVENLLKHMQSQQHVQDHTKQDVR
ncbi:unnamed protein product [Adineta steineri]|uniref:D domain-containing protein n=1 Tax=Adineta steineri TaxID=433720 RepID=A0A816B7T6_9BILA|nr:unnamed protein product [Adineta steineri]CAF1607832.1 unnamed protein product [Adineta steineri]